MTEGDTEECLELKESRACAVNPCECPPATPAPTTETCMGCERGMCPFSGSFLGFAVWVGAQGSMQEWICWHACEHHQHCSYALFCDLADEHCKEDEQCLLYERAEKSWVVDDCAQFVQSAPDKDIYKTCGMDPFELMRELGVFDTASCDVVPTTPAPTTPNTPAPNVTFSPTPKPTPAPTPEAVDCDIGEWSDWDACTEPCDGGVTTRAR